MLKAWVKALTDVVEGFRGEYVANPDAKKGGFILSVEKTEGIELADTGGLMSALEKERTAAQTATNTLKLYGDITPDAARENAKRAADAAAGRSEDIKTAVKARETELIATFDTQTKALTARAEKAEKGLHRHVVVNAATADIVAEGGSPHLLLPVVVPMLQAVEEGDSHRVAVIVNGQERVGGVKDGHSVPMTSRQLVQELKKSPEYGPAFNVKAGGSGSDGKGTSKQTPTTDDSKTLTMTPAAKLTQAREKAAAMGKT